MTFAEKLKKERLRKEVTQTEVAKAVGVTQTAISYFESGFRNPEQEVLIRLAKYYGVSTDYLLGLTSEV